MFNLLCIDKSGITHSRRKYFTPDEINRFWQHLELMTEMNRNGYRMSWSLFFFYVGLKKKTFEKKKIYYCLRPIEVMILSAP